MAGEPAARLEKLLFDAGDQVHFRHDLHQAADEVQASTGKQASTVAAAQLNTDEANRVLAGLSRDRLTYLAGGGIFLASTWLR